MKQCNYTGTQKRIRQIKQQLIFNNCSSVILWLRENFISVHTVHAVWEATGGLAELQVHQRS